jgi:tryptophan-rich sensory protein
MSPLLIATLVTLAVVGLESLCAGRAPLDKLRRLRQPAWSPPASVWVLIGLAWYAIAFVGLVRLLSRDDATPSVRLLVALLVANALVNVPQFRWNRLDIAFFYLVPYWALLARFLVSVHPHDAVTFKLFAAYAVYQVYAAAWQWQLWRLNRG